MSNKIKAYQSYFFIFVLLVFTYLAYRVLQPLLYDMIIAVIFSALLSPVYRYFLKLKLSPICSSSLCLVAFILVITIPLYTLINDLYSELTTINFNALISNLIHLWETNPYLQMLKTYLPDFNFDETYIKNIFFQFVGLLTKQSGAIIQQTSSLIFHTVMVLYIMFYLLIDGISLRDKIIAISPLEKKNEMELFNKIVDIIRAILFGSILIALLEGIFGMFLFIIAGLKAPVFWGFVMIIFSLLPILGANTVLLPASIFCLIVGDYSGFFLLLVIGCGGIAISQNIIKVKIVGNRVRIPSSLIVLSTVGGIVWIGPIGFMLGPIILGIFLVILDQYSVKFREELKLLNKNTHE